MPTGTGKTFVALKAMARLSKPALVVVSTLDLQAQWSERVEEGLGFTPGLLGGGRHEIRPVTVATYNSTYLHAEELGDRFGLIIFDEVHHLPAPNYRVIAEFSAVPLQDGAVCHAREGGRAGRALSDAGRGGGSSTGRRSRSWSARRWRRSRSAGYMWTSRPRRWRARGELGL